MLTRSSELPHKVGHEVPGLGLLAGPFIDQVVQIVGERKVEVVREGVGGYDLMPLDIGAAKPTVGLSGANELRVPVA